MFYILWLIAIGGALTNLFVSKKPRDLVRVTDLFLRWVLGITVGLGGILAFYGHVFMGPAIAKSIGWPAGNPFQFEIGIANLALGVLGLLCFWRRGDFWLATIIFATIFGWGAGAGHIIQIVQVRNFAPGNAGAVLYGDFIGPLIIIALYVVRSWALSHKQQTEWANTKIRRVA